MLTIQLIGSLEFGWKKKFNMENIAADTSSGCEQAQGHELRANKLTIKLIDSS